jgi:type IV pilus assembly protein PilW
MLLDLSSTPRQRLRGVTLVELMVALAVSMIVALAALAALNIARQGFTVNDAASQLRENGRFVSDLLQRLVVQTGFKDLSYSTTTRPTNVAGIVSNPPPAIYGLNNRSRVSTDAWNAGTAWTSGAAGYGSDILVLRFQPSSNSSTATAADGSMINCNGESLTALPTNRDDRAISILHVGADSDGEPSLMCSSIPVNNSTVTQTTLVRGVENFQVLYGVDGIAPGNTSTASTATPNLPDRYLRADQLTVSNLAASYYNWRHVRSVRIGLVLRSPPGQSPDATSATFLPFGVGKSSASASSAAGSALSSSDDPGTTASENTFTDTRFRRAVTFTIHLRNDQGS